MMRFKSSGVLFTLVGGICLGAPQSVAGPPTFVLKADGVSVAPGSTVELTVTLDNTSPIAAWNFGLQLVGRGALPDFISASEGEAVKRADFFVTTPVSPGGLIVGVVVDLFGQVTFPAGSDQEILVATIEVPDDAIPGTVFDVNFVDTVGDPPVDVTIIDDRDGVHIPLTVSGSITIVDAGCTADLDDDGVVGPADLAQLLGAWGECARSCPADVDGDGTVGPADLALLLGAWGCV